MLLLILLSSIVLMFLCKRDHFLKHFIDKIAAGTTSVQLPDYDPSVTPSTCSALFHQFKPVSFTTLLETVKNLKPYTSPQYIILTGIVN